MSGLTAGSQNYAELEKLMGSNRHLRKRIIGYMAVRNLVMHKLRTVLTAGGVLIGIGSITFLLSLGLGLQNLVSKQVLSSQSVTAIDVTPPTSNVVTLTSASVSKISQVDGVKDIAKSYTLASKASLGSSTTDAVVYGADQAYLDLSSLNKISAGSRELDSGHILVNTSLLKLIGVNDYKAAIGKTLTLDLIIPRTNQQKDHYSVSPEISGVVDTGNGSEIFMPIDDLAKANIGQFSQVKVVTVKESQVSEVRKAIEGLGFTTASPLDTINQINQVFTFFNFILAGFGGIGMLIAVLGMFNTLTISLLERTRETALMISLGARRSDVYKLFVAEAIGLAIVGGIMGIAVAWLLGIGINVLLMRMASSRGVTDAINLFALPWWLLLGTMSFVVFVAILVVGYPAFRAVRVNPVDALRRE